MTAPGFMAPTEIPLCINTAPTHNSLLKAHSSEVAAIL
eukprot:CAMPEP_0181190984 /NCGR_PEP_ID=MMETSP1096-20121128/12487_1 /TAXON_ID=156174 ORGANISM="Chrysochromulina ericina, Strain CCMP281" /NCGR_SAMPLE_ID=MMETSP1096 /ASSEMBLY_ACC=CAM_ASM_000453 /LENGTH=37 /DNA_ID= /DNA_START= /DNA_END= /DNA_ORIENTATION=